MSDETRPNPAEADQTGAAKAGAAEAEAAKAGAGKDAPEAGRAPAAEAEAPAAPDPVEALKAENGELKDRVLRTLAEMENLRRRTEKEIKDTRDYAISGFARELLVVCDNLARAVAAIPPETRASSDGGIKALVEGVEMTARELIKALEKHGVRKLDPLGARFDPNLHQAMFEIPNGEVPSGTVLQVLQDGYVIGERVLRPALVGVAKGGPKPAAPEPAGIDKTV